MREARLRNLLLLPSSKTLAFAAVITQLCNTARSPRVHTARSDADGSGELTKPEFAEAMRGLGFISVTDAQIDRTWRHLDSDGDGHVPYMEVSRCSRAYVVSSSSSTSSTTATQIPLSHAESRLLPCSSTSVFATRLKRSPSCGSE